MLCSCQDWKDWIYSKTSSKEFLKRYVPYPWFWEHVSMRHWPCLLNCVLSPISWQWVGLWSLNGIHSWSNAWANTTSFAHEQLFNWIRGPVSHAPVSSDNPRVCQLSDHNIAALYHMHVWSGLGRSCPLAIHFVIWKFCILLPIQLQTIKDWHLWNGSANCAR